MGKSRKKRKIAKQGNYPSRKKGMSRRKFITLAGLAVGTAAAYPLFNVGRNLLRDDTWNFLEPLTTPKPDNYMDVIQKYVELGFEAKMGKRNKEFPAFQKELTPLIKENMKALGSYPSEFSVLATIQNFGVPYPSRITKPLYDYVQQSILFLEDRVKGIQKNKINLTIIKKGDNYSKNYATRGFLGGSCFTIYRAKAKHRSDAKKEFETGYYKHVEGGLALLFPKGDTNLKDDWYFFIGSGPTALTSPFSEILPLSLRDNITSHKKHVGAYEGIEAVETVTEAMAYLLSLEFAKMKSVPRGAELINNSYKKVSKIKIYQYVPQAVKWMKENSIQSGFDLYKESPIKFMDTIKKV